MVKITEQLVRSRAEHNELQISTLEEISLHQQDIEKIEHLDRWCKDLKILYLQSNLIPKIENVSKLKKLEYLNLALNNVELIENLEGCESLEKLDLTINFVGELTSVDSLCHLEHFHTLYLTGNPCAEFEYYREYVIATLPHLKYLDGNEVSKKERILAKQDYEVKRKAIIAQQTQHRKKREKEKCDAGLRKQNKEKKPGFDGRWYTDMNSESVQVEENTNKGNGDDDDSEFWNEKVPFSPESRIEVHEHMKNKKAKEKQKEEEEPKKPRRLIANDGHALNVNEAKLEFSLVENDETNDITLDLAVYKYLDTSLIDIDVQPKYVRAFVKGKAFQLELPEEVNPDASTAKRSQITGHLLVTMPKAKPMIVKKNNPKAKSKSTESDEKRQSNGHERLEVDNSKKLDYSNIVKDKKVVPPLGHRDYRSNLPERPNSADFVDDPDVPPLI
ncbi:dynein axonemal assembly factor 11-like [Tubulanus polymorphus]|uniref:dynein axonemal assembly factor 11-like n=1 Tax=Tubulanus polymorphus TaxID=672921 RepID=UPI003DA32B08